MTSRTHLHRCKAMRELKPSPQEQEMKLTVANSREHDGGR